jgi:hypothetical protein
VLTAWLSRDNLPAIEPMPVLSFDALMALVRSRTDLRERRRILTVEALRVAMCAAAVGFLLALARAEDWTWIPLASLVWLLALAADYIEGSLPPWHVLARRALAVFLVFQYVCFAWVFFRATSFDNALAVLRAIGDHELGHANLVPLVTTAMAVGLLCHFFADGSFRWLRERFVALPPWAQGAVLAAAALVLRELGHAKLVKFIYFQF